MNNPHENARTCVYSREQIALRHHNGEPASAIAAAFGISVRTVHKWLKRHRDHGPQGLLNRSSRPHANPRAFTSVYDDVIARLRTFRLTALDIAGALGLARSTVAHVLKRMGPNRRDRLDPPQPVRRYERDRPADLIHLDIKKLGVLRKWAIASLAITGASARVIWAMIMSMWPSTTIQGWHMSRHCPTRKATHAPLPGPSHPMVLTKRRHRATGHDRQRCRLHLSPLP